MSSQGIAVQDRLGDTTDHAVPPGKPVPRGSGAFLYASGDKPLAGYVIKRGVGSGGFGEVYYAISDAGKEVAIKLIRRNLDTELRGMQQCLNFKHPNLLALYDIRQDDSGDTWVVMEYMSGKSLEDDLADHPQGLPVQQALAWFHGIAAGVAYLHDHGVVHRDLKPGNIFRDEGVVKVGDYGLSKFISCSRRSGHTESIGTVHYMAPEVAHGRYGKELDIYALGAILFELLTGRVPFEGESVGEVLMKHLTAQPDVAKLVEPFRGVVARAMEKDPSRRFATVGQMLAALPAAAAAPAILLGVPTTAHGPARSPHAPGSIPASSAPLATLYTPVAVLAVDEGVNPEPIAQFVAQQAQRLKRHWRSDLNPGTKGLIVAGVIVIGLLSVGLWLPMGMFLLLAYGGYRLVRFAWLVLFPPASVGRVIPAAAARNPSSRTVREDAIPALLVKPRAVRAAELIGSLLVAAAVTAVTCLVMLPVAAYCGMPLQVEQSAWLYLVSLAGAWLVLIPAKFWEGSPGERVLRHFTLMIIGFGLGLVAYSAGEFFLVRLPADADFSYWIAHKAISPAFFQDGRPTAIACVAAFAAVLAVLRWWVDADPMRAARLSVWSVLVTVAVAFVVARACQFPAPGLMMVAASMSITVQLASPWVPTYARLRPQRKKVL
jgi:hypothetical protein